MLIPLKMHFFALLYLKIYSGNLIINRKENSFNIKKSTK